MIFNVMDWEKDTDSEKIHPTQKPVKILENLIKIFTDEGEVVIDPVAGSGSTLLASLNTNRNSYGFEIKKNFFNEASKVLNENILAKDEIKTLGWAKTAASKIHPVLDFQ
jgi:site-specific DNA-methyltransferase (adenine-specific)